ncbi:hypothetical protein CRENBAI_003238 [Crenichthys baileyi]|uniref:Uncharacterized protein n=1 Tax=Crenichthys baileyi TaxID=28760 RepID=A0AAV9SLL1_9TELE
MNNGANIEVLSQSQKGAGVSSSLPLPQTMMPLPKMDSKQYSGLPIPKVQYQLTARGQPAYFSSSASSGPADVLRGKALKANLLQQKTGMYSNRGPADTERTNGTCSAYNSPQIPKRDIPRSKDTLDLRNSALTHKALRDLQLKRNTNKNWTFGKSRLRNLDNAREGDTFLKLSANFHSGQERGHLLYTKRTNGNEKSCPPSAGLEHFQRDVRDISNQDLGTFVGDLFGNKARNSYQKFNMKRRGSEPGKISMAAIAPFRSRFQVSEDTDTTLDDLSDCSSDSMEVCCDDFGESAAFGYLAHWVL